MYKLGPKLGGGSGESRTTYNSALTAIVSSRPLARISSLSLQVIIFSHVYQGHAKEVCDEENVDGA